MKNTRKGKNKFIIKYYVLTGAVVLVSFLIFGIMMLVLITTHWWNDKVDMLETNSNTIATDYINVMNSDGKNKTLEALILGNDLKTVSVAAEAVYLVCNADGDIILCPEFIEGDGHICSKHGKIKIKQELITRAKTERFTSFTSLDDDIRDSFIVVTPIIKDGAVVGEIFAVEDAVHGILPYIVSILKMMLVAAVFSLLVACLAIYFYTRRTTKPIADMIEAMGRYAKGDFTCHVDTRGATREMVQMGEAINKMVDELAVDDEARRSFVANVSHELKTPMTTISGFVDGILDGTIPKEKEKEYLSTVSTEVKRLARLVVTMLNLSKMESGEVNIQPIEYNISSQILETLLSMEQKISEKHIEIKGLEDIADIKIYADRDLLHQVIYNLLDNAVKFTPENGEIYFIAEKSEKSTSIILKNTGVGMTKEETARIFERFYKVDKSRSFDIKGVGLGLYIVKTIVNMHDGTISAESEPGKYTQFKFTLPDK